MSQNLRRLREINATLLGITQEQIKAEHNNIENTEEKDPDTMLLSQSQHDLMKIRKKSEPNSFI